MTNLVFIVIILTPIIVTTIAVWISKKPGAVRPGLFALEDVVPDDLAEESGDQPRGG